VTRFVAWGGALAAVLLALAAPLAGQQTTNAGADKLEPFTLSDQNEKEHVVRLPLRRLTLFTVADKQGAQEVSGWVNPVHALYQERVDIVGIANVSAAPRWFRGQVRRYFRRTYPHPVLLDWEGKVIKSMKAEGQAVTVLVAAPDGTIIYRAGGPATAAGMEKLLQLLHGELEKAR